MNVVPVEEGNTNTEGGSLNPDLRIREKGILGNRTLPIQRANEVCPVSEKHYKFEEQSISKSITKHCCY